MPQGFHSQDAGGHRSRAASPGGFLSTQHGPGAETLRTEASNPVGLPAGAWARKPGAKIHDATPSIIRIITTTDCVARRANHAIGRSSPLGENIPLCSSPDSAAYLPRSHPFTKGVSRSSRTSGRAVGLVMQNPLRGSVEIVVLPVF